MNRSAAAPAAGGPADSVRRLPSSPAARRHAQELGVDWTLATGAGSTLFLLSDDASFITGADLAVDAGYCAMGPEGLGKTARFAESD